MKFKILFCQDVILESKLTYRGRCIFWELPIEFFLKIDKKYRIIFVQLKKWFLRQSLNYIYFKFLKQNCKM